MATQGFCLLGEGPARSGPPLEPAWPQDCQGRAGRDSGACEQVLEQEEAPDSGLWSPLSSAHPCSMLSRAPGCALPGSLSP